MKDIQTIFAEGNLKKALKKLHHHIREHAPDWEPSVLVLKSNFAHLEKQELDNVISAEEASRERNRITSSALDLLAQTEAGEPSPPPSIDPAKEEMPPAPVMNQKIENTTNITGSHIQVEGSKDVVIGSGNTINKQVVNALGKWQFWAILGGIVLVGGFGVFGLQNLSGGQETVVSSVRSVQQELEALAEEKPELKEQLEDLKQQLQSGLAAMKQENYPLAIEQLEQLVQQAPIANLYLDLATAYEKNGQLQKAYETRSKAKSIDPSLFRVKKASEISGKYLDLLAPENGPEAAIVSNAKIEALADGELKPQTVSKYEWAIYNFNEERTATIDRVDFYIPNRNSSHPVDFEILVSMEMTEDSFTSVGVFKPLNALNKKTPFQEFTFEPVKAKYVKVIIGDQHGVWDSAVIYEMKVWGRLR